MKHSILIEQVSLLLEDETDVLANLSNISAAINMMLSDINWVGFYLFKDDHLVLGPFQGKVACTRLYPGKGVCSYAIETKKTQIIDNVHEFEGHVACDAASNSELVVPIYINDKPYGVLDIDSPSFNRFSKEDGEAMEKIVTLLIDNIKKNQG